MDAIKKKLATSLVLSRLLLLLLLGYSLLIMSAANVLRANSQQQQQARQDSADWLLAPTASCQRLKLVKRQEWGAKRSLGSLESFGSSSSSSSGAAAPTADGQPAIQQGEGIPNRVFIHQAWDGRSCADIDSCSIRLQAIQAYHQHSKGWPDISYNFLISADGTVYEGLGFSLIGFHTLDYNYDSLGVAFIGTFQDVYPTVEMERALQDLLTCATDSNYLATDYMLHGHRDARCTICPGDATYERISQLAHFRPGPLARYTCPRQVSARRQPQTGPMMAALTARGDERTPSISVASQRNRISDRGESHLQRSLSFRDDPERDDEGVDENIGTEFGEISKSLSMEKASISKASKDQLILVNLQPQQASDSQQQQQQPTLYVLTKTSVSKTVPILLISPLATGSSAQSSTGSGSDRGGGSSRAGSSEGGGGSGSRGSSQRPGSQGSSSADESRGGSSQQGGKNSNTGSSGEEEGQSNNPGGSSGGGME